MIRISDLISKAVISMVVAVTVLAGFSAQAQYLTNGIASITCDRADPAGNNPVLNVGTEINISILLHGSYERTEQPGTVVSAPELKLVVNGEPAYATMTGFSRVLTQNRPRTELIFTYTVRSGDMTSPLTIYGSAGMGTTPGGGFQFLWNGWNITQVGYPDVEAEWIYDFSDPSFTDIYDIDLSKANVTIQTLFFDTVNNSDKVAATESVTWRVFSYTPIELGSIVTFYVWPADYNLVELGGVPAQPYLIMMTPGSTFVDFPVKGLIKGDTEIFLQGKTDYNNGVTNNLYNNFIPSPVAISVIDPPAPTVKVIMNANSSQSITLDEINPPNTGRFHVELSETNTSDITVLVDASYFSGNPQSSVIMLPDPVQLLIKAGELSSGTANFNIPDGVPESQISAVLLTPAIQGITASNKYNRVVLGTVYVNNVAPVVYLPQLPANNTFEITSGIDTSFEFAVDDVTADLTNNMTTVWNFGDGTTNMYKVGPNGQIYHRYTASGTYHATVRAEDKDGAASVVQFIVEVIPPQPQPTVSVVTTAGSYDETKDLNTGSFYIQLSETFNEAADFYVEVDPVTQPNIILSYTGPYTISQGTNRSHNVQFSVIDGTVLSGMSGIVLRPVISNVNAAAKFTDVQDTRIYLENIDPVITNPLASDPALPPDPTYGYNQIPYGVPFDFRQRIDDVAADLASMETVWDFGDGDILTFAGAVRNITHTYTSFGDHPVTVMATDKDGGSSTLIAFKVTVVEPPPPPMVEILVPVATILESDADGVHKIGVELNEPFGENVVVNLAVDPIGNIGLRPTQVTFSPGQTHKDVDILVYNGDEDSAYPGIYVIPTVLGTVNAIMHFQVESSAVRVVNVDPVIRLPLTNTYFEVVQGKTVRFDWDVDDVNANLDNTMRIEWRWGDGSTTFNSGGQGSVYHVYTGFGTKAGILIVTDKDGGEARRYFTVVITQPKMVIVTPIGPNLQASYYGMDGLGNGTVASQEAESVEFRELTYCFKYSPIVNAATLEAIPYPEIVSGKLYDSFFYVWIGADQGLPNVNLNPSTTSPSTPITLPEIALDANGFQTDSLPRNVTAVFSREWRYLDNMGDINQDGIPDKISQHYGLAEMVATEIGMTNGYPVDLIDAHSYNGDGDYLPNAPFGGSDTINPDGTTIFAAIGPPFTAFIEVRGLHEGLNNHEYGSEPYGPEDEPGANGTVGGSNPISPDTDGDNLPDGWEYYFWYNARFHNLTGESFDQAVGATGMLIGSNDIEVAFSPLVYAGFNRDLDNDGLTDIEELTIGTNPVHWDTDGDTFSDGWEISQEMNPNDPHNYISQLVALEISGKSSVYEGETSYYRCIAYYDDESHADATDTVQWGNFISNNYQFVDGALLVGTLTSNDNCVISASYGGMTQTKSIDLIDFSTFTVPYLQGFESGENSWKGSSVSEFNWVCNSGATPSSGTGPSMASEGNYYLYAEASAPNSPVKVAAIEAKFDFGAALLPALSFDYHMYGATMGALYVDVYNGTWHEAVWSRIGEQHQSSDTAWSMASVDLGEYAGISNLLIRVRAVTGNQYLSDIAIDNIALIDNISTMEPSFNKWAVVERIPSDSRSQTNSPAMDGIPNLLKYACGLDAMTPATTADLMAIEALPSDDNFAIIYYRSMNAQDVLLSPVWSSSLFGGWSEKGVTVTEGLQGNDGQRQQWRASIPLGTKGFIRLRAELVE